MVRPGQHRQRMPMNKGNHKSGHYSSNRPSNNSNAAANQVGGSSCYLIRGWELLGWLAISRPKLAWVIKRKKSFSDFFHI